MQQPGPLIAAFDLATLTGYAIGRAGERPRFGTWRLKTPDDEPERASRNLGCQLRDLFSIEKPDIVAYEAAISAGGMLRMGNASHTAGMLLQLPGALQAICGCYGVRAVKKNVQNVRKNFVGKGRPDDPKRAVLDQCRVLGFDVKDDNAADALAIWHVQAGFVYGELALARVAG